jgi:hypothetical protein
MEYMSHTYFLPAESGNPTVPWKVSRKETVHISSS